MLPRALRHIRDGLLGLVYPQHCRVCGGAVESWDDGVACAACWDDPRVTKLLNGTVCSKCGIALSRTVPAHEELAEMPRLRFCGMCSSLPFAAARACGVYSGALEANILFLKTTPHICPRLRRIIRATLSDHGESLKSELIVPVPLHHSRQRERGFNQAAIVAGIISRALDLPVCDRSLVRSKPTARHRAGMDAADRAQSVERAFEVSRPRSIKGTSVLLIDDVYTTGSTICAATRALIESGARRVNILTLARVGNR
ncbi:MAG: phosphoribosyltransferase family protein [Blastocatellia bacterium]